MIEVQWLDWLNWGIAETLKYVLCTYGIFGVPVRRNKFRYLSILAVVTGIFLGELNDVEELFYQTFLGFFILWNIFEVSVIDMVQLFIAEFYLISLSDMLVWAVYHSIVNTEYVSYMTLTTWLSNLCTIALLLIVSFICRKHREVIYKRIKEERTGIKVLIIVALMIVTTAISSVQGVLFGRLSGSILKIAVMAIVVSILLFVVMFILLFSARQSRRRLLRINELTGEQMNLQKRYFEEARHADEQVKMLRHDLKNHMLLMRIMLEDGETDHLREYLEKLTEQYQAIELESTGNTVADCLLKNMINRLKSSGKLDYMIEGKFTPYDRIDDMDCCILLSNALDNAREALEQLPEEERIFRMKIGHYGKALCLRISNRALYVSTDELHTTKKEGNHGYGIKNMKRIAEKYNGSISWTYQNGEMVVDIILDGKDDKISTKI